MGKQDDLAALIYKLKESGIDAWQCCIVNNGVFFPSRQFAVNFCKRHDKELVRVSGQVSGWLAKDKPTAKSKKAKG